MAHPFLARQRASSALEAQMLHVAHPRGPPSWGTQDTIYTSGHLEAQNRAIQESLVDKLKKCEETTAQIKDSLDPSDIRRVAKSTLESPRERRSLSRSTTAMTTLLPFQ